MLEIPKLNLHPQGSLPDPEGGDVDIRICKTCVWPGRNTRFLKMCISCRREAHFRLQRGPKSGGGCDSARVLKLRVGVAGLTQFQHAGRGAFWKDSWKGCNACEETGLRKFAGMNVSRRNLGRFQVVVPRTNFRKISGKTSRHVSGRTPGISPEQP